MSLNMINEDLRSIRTKKALYSAMFSLLKKISFRKITIKKICEEALISRAAFYTHFIDKYDLLKHWVINLLPEDFGSFDTYQQIEKIINDHLRENMTILENLVFEADYETLGILFDCILSTVHLTVEKTKNKELYSKNIVLSNFYAGGMISYLLWQIGNRFPSEVPLMNEYLFRMVNKFHDRTQEGFLR